MRKISVSAVIPAYNEAGAVGPVVERVREALSRHAAAGEVIVVDDGSTDGTREAAEAAGATVLRHPVNRGYGSALITGIAAAKHEFVLMIDADGSYPPEDISKLLAFAPDFDLVIGSRTGAHFWGSPASALLRWIYLRIAAFIVGERVPDANSGLRLVRRRLLLVRGPVQCLGFSYSTTMTLSFLHAGRFVKFVPVAYEARVGRSKVSLLRDILRTLQLMTEVLIAYNPLKLFVTLTAFPAAAALVLLGGWAWRGDGAWLVAGVISACAALACFSTGCLLDSIRIHRARD